MIWDSLNAQEIGQVNIPVVLEYFVETYAWLLHGTSQFRGGGGLYWLAPDGLSGVAEAVISGQIRVVMSHPHYRESRFR